MSPAPAPVILGQIKGEMSLMMITKRQLRNISHKYLQSPPQARAHAVSIGTTNLEKFVVLSLNIPLQHRHLLGKSSITFPLKQHNKLSEI